MKIYRHLKQIITVGLLTIVAVILFGGCTELINLLNLTNIQKPDAKLEDVKLNDLTFNEADMLFNIRISNPNAVSVNLSGFDYNLLINDASLLKSNENTRIEIPARGTTNLPLPVTLVFKDIYEIYQGLKDADSLDYTLNTVLRFDLPTIGAVQVPLSYSGALPNLKLPKIALKQIRLEKIGITGADLRMQISVDNPNAWAMMLNRFDYQLKVGGRQWIQGNKDKQQNISGKSDGVLEVPIFLNFMDMGKSVYDMIAGSEKLDYHLSGQVDLGSSIEMLGQFNVPFDKSGKIEITK